MKINRVSIARECSSIKDEIDGNNNKTIFLFDLYLTKLQLDYEREYLKVQDVAATVGGLFSITYNVLKFINYFYIENSLIYYYFQHLFFNKLFLCVTK